MLLIIAQIVFIQVVAVTFVIFILKFVLEYKLVELGIKDFEFWATDEEDYRPSQVLVTSHKNLSEARKNRIRESAQKKFGPTVEVKFEVDRSLMGGIIITFDQYSIKLSLRNRLQESGFLK